MKKKNDMEMNNKYKKLKRIKEEKGEEQGKNIFNRNYVK